MSEHSDWWVRYSRHQVQMARFAWWLMGLAVVACAVIAFWPGVSMGGVLGWLGFAALELLLLFLWRYVAVLGRFWRERG